MLIFIFFFLMFLGVNITFFPLHFSGLQGYPRKYIDYSDSHRLWNRFSSLGSVITVFALFIFIYMLFNSLYFFCLGLVDDKGSQNLERSSSNYVGFHSYIQNVSLFS